MIDPTKTYKTRDGREVRIYAVDGDGEYPVHGAYKYDGRWQVNQWTATGGTHFLTQGDYFDLIEFRPRIKREVWVNVYPNGTKSFGEKRFADEHAMDHRIACVRLTIDCEEGEGL